MQLLPHLHGRQRPHRQRVPQRAEVRPRLQVLQPRRPGQVWSPRAGGTDCAAHTEASSEPGGNWEFNRKVLTLKLIPVSGQTPEMPFEKYVKPVNRLNFAQLILQTSLLKWSKILSLLNCHHRDQHRQRGPHRGLPRPRRLHRPRGRVTTPATRGGRGRPCQTFRTRRATLSSFAVNLASPR